MALVLAFLLHAGGAGDAPAGRAAAQSTAPATESRLRDLLGSLKPQTRVGVQVVDVPTGTVVFSHGAETPLKPASLQKLFITAAALERFGAEFRFRTRLYLHGNELWLVGSGDPGLGDPRLEERAGRPVTRVFDEWANSLRTREVSQLSRIVLDDSVFDEQHRHPDWPDDQADRWYQAPVGGLSFNDNCLDVEVIVEGNDVRLQLIPDLPPELWHSTLAVGKEQRPVLRRAPGSDKFELSGTIRYGGHLDPVAAGRPPVFFGFALHKALESRGIAVPGPVVRRALTPAELENAALLTTYETPLADVVWRCNRFSQNLFAECLLKSLEAYRPDGSRSGVPGSWEGGRRVLEETLRRLGLELEGAVFRDGSGLSHSNRVSAAQVAELLVIMQGHPWGALFEGSLAEPGEAGSLESRYDDPSLRGRLRAKTGTISGVRCLAGYVTTHTGRKLAFALLINGNSPRDWPTALCRALLGVE